MELISEDGKVGMLRMWVDGFRRAGITNYMVIAIDDNVAAVMEQLEVPYWRTTPHKTRDKKDSNHGISATKFQLIKEFLLLNVSVLLSDVDIVILQNPFDHLYRDKDVESLTDGFDNSTAYGYDDGWDDPQMGWSRYARTFRIFSLNSGLFYIVPNARTIALMERITVRLDKNMEWDQAVFNEEVWKPSFGSYRATNVSLRIMDLYDFVNSKTLFKSMRYEGLKHHMPVMVHVNYHPDKWERMQSIWARYVDGDLTALDKYPIGECETAPDCT
eukprot:gene31415-6583_t